MRSGRFKVSISSSLLIVVFVGAILFFIEIVNTPDILSPARIRSTASVKAPVKMKKSRWEYFFRMLRDPVTNQIPPGIRQRELAFSRRLARSVQKVDSLFTWKEAGPTNLGGRTRALAVDITNPNIIIAGGVSGGIWKSTDGGSTWNQKSDPSQNLSITSLAQDLRPGQTNNWYYATGEFVGNSASDQGFRSPFYGSGLYKSTDNGDTWQLLSNSGGNNPTSWDSPFDYVSRIVISPTTGNIFVACNGIGIYQSINDGKSFNLVLGGINDHYYSDVVVAADGKVIAVLSQFGYNTNPANNPGIYKSINNGLSWINITPSNFPETYERSFVACAPSNPDIIYILTFTGKFLENDQDDVRFFKMYISSGNSEDRSENLPNFGDEGFVHTQTNYNMVVAVKPDDEDFVLIGATSLFKSTDGFKTKSQDVYNTWIGGYEPTNSPEHYPNLHPDQHVIFFYPSDPIKVWVGHDGGVSFTPNITESASSLFFFPWENKNYGYNVTQFYTVTLPPGSDDNRIMGGTQDNGTPYFIWDGTIPGNSKDLSSGDGAFAYFGKKFAYVSSSKGRILRVKYNQSGNPSLNTGWTIITPIGARNQIFITPFAIDPNNEDVLFYPSGDEFWRNTRLGDIPEHQDSTSVGWSKLSHLQAPTNYIISAVAISRYNPKHVLYYGSSSLTQSPKIHRLANAHNSSKKAEEISIPNLPSGSYLHSIAINPNDGNEILVILSNYNIIGLYHSDDGGKTYEAIEGNLKGDVQYPGPSLRSGSILPTTEKTIYLVGTSTGLYSTMDIDGHNTLWTKEGEANIGNVVVSHVTSRTSDGKIAAGTHGRGVFIGDPNSNIFKELPQQLLLEQNYPNPFNHMTTINYTLPRPAFVNLVIFNLQGQRVYTLVSEYKNADSHSIQWDAKNFASGIYLLRASAGSFSQTKKCVLIK